MHMLITIVDNHITTATGSLVLLITPLAWFIQEIINSGAILMPTATQMSSVTRQLVTHVLYLLYSVASDRMTLNCLLWQQVLCKLEDFLWLLWEKLSASMTKSKLLFYSNTANLL